MKNFLRSFFLFLSVGLVLGVQAQSPTSACDIDNIIMQNLRPAETQTDPNLCTVTFDLTFTLSANNGNKYVFLQTYIQQTTAGSNPNPYPNYFNCENGQSTRRRAPQGSEVGNPLVNIVINNTGATPTFQNTYVPDPTVPVRGVTAGTTISTSTLPGGATQFVITGITATLPYACGTAQSILVTDVFASQAANANNIHCVSCGILAPEGVVTVQGEVNCGDNTLAILARNNSNLLLTGTYAIYADNGDMILDTLNGTDERVTGGPFALNPLQTITDRGEIPEQFLENSFFLVYRLAAAGVEAQTAVAVFIESDGCIVTPVRFRSFSVNRKNQGVVLNWETADEINNKGFTIQRNTGSGWQDIAFVPSAANGGNSSSVIAYEFTDINNFRGVTQYRLQQVDLDGRSSFSELRSIKGLDIAGRTIIYPNPTNGRFNVVFDDGAARKDVYVTDMNGKVVKQFKGVINNVYVENLMPGMYMVRIVDVQSGAQTSEKVVVSNR